jgi:hypothetical protein
VIQIERSKSSEKAIAHICKVAGMSTIGVNQQSLPIFFNYGEHLDCQSCP